MYRLHCLGCGAAFTDDGMLLHCPQQHAPALLRSVYATQHFTPDAGMHGIMRYRHWLPLREEQLPNAPATAVFQSHAINTELRTPNLWLAFNGYWPARAALLPTATFKDLETAAILARFPRDRTLVAASAGNTAAALARACSLQGRRAIIVVPEAVISALLERGPFASCVQIVPAAGTASYDEAISHAKRLGAGDASVVFEGGVANVARRDGIGTTMLAAVEALGALPEYFVQAIGSGAGAIAAHEAALRLRTDGRYGATLPKLLLVQNSPSAPVYESWRKRSRMLIGYADSGRAREERVAALWAPVLSAQQPPYTITGGLYDVLTQSDGDVTVVENAQARAANELFARLEPASIVAASAVALAGLIAALDAKRLPRQARIVLHITGGSVRAEKSSSAA